MNQMHKPSPRIQKQVSQNYQSTLKKPIKKSGCGCKKKKYSN
ncbi:MULTISPECIES: hypothetical protein [Bacillus]|uniref:Uncharacterized protein n=1 Tax=Bacillus capparidis TaxID=1840411 RepID=A0ABS4CR99_9BACI|nr:MULTISPECIES: hypothetical protein [Bacillus]MBP1079676.1 hypothetical protein [Bacillus capparidis]MED1095078.1 hypothetical protein [Bacillus capparidis]